MRLKKRIRPVEWILMAVVLTMIAWKFFDMSQESLKDRTPPTIDELKQGKKPLYDDTLREGSK